MCLWLEKGASESKTVPPDEEYLKVLLSVALNHSPLQRSLTANFTKRPLEQADYLKTSEGDPGCVLIHPNSHESVFTRHHTEDTNCWCCFLFFLTILYRRIPPLRGIPCQSGTFSVPSVSSCRFLSSLHYTSPLYLNEECPSITLKGFSNRIAIILRDLRGN